MRKLSTLENANQLTHMEKRKLGNTDLELPVVGFGASSLGQEFRQVKLDEALESVHVALDLGMNLIDTSDVYGFDWGGTGFGTVEALLAELS